MDSTKLSEQRKRKFEKISSETGNAADLKMAFKNLTEYLFLHYGVRFWAFINEYDSPLQEAYRHNDYEDMAMLMRGMLGSTLKSNDYLHGYNWNFAHL